MFIQFLMENLKVKIKRKNNFTARVEFEATTQKHFFLENVSFMKK